MQERGGCTWGVLFLRSYGCPRYGKDLCVECFISCIDSVFLSVACLVAAISVIDYCRIVALSMVSVVYIV